MSRPCVQGACGCGFLGKRSVLCSLADRRGRALSTQSREQTLVQYECIWFARAQEQATSSRLQGLVSSDVLALCGMTLQRSKPSRWVACGESVSVKGYRCPARVAADVARGLVKSFGTFMSFAALKYR